MKIFNFITLAGGLAFFLYGMHVMSAGLEKMAGGKLEKVLKKMTSNPLKGMVLGAGITIAIQSSSAMTVMLVGLVNSGVMKLSQTVSLIMGSNIGTTLTAWILSMSGIEGDSFFIKMLKPTSFAPIIALIGIGWAAIGVNSYPMIVAMASGNNIGKFTGTYYTFSMAAQICTPILSGLLLEHISYRTLFPYALVFSILAFLTMTQVRHGDVKAEKKGSLIEHFDVDD